MDFRFTIFSSISSQQWQNMTKKALKLNLKETTNKTSPLQSSISNRYQIFNI